MEADGCARGEARGGLMLMAAGEAAMLVAALGRGAALALEPRDDSTAA